MNQVELKRLFGELMDAHMSLLMSAMNMTEQNYGKAKRDLEEGIETIQNSLKTIMNKL